MYGMFWPKTDCLSFLVKFFKNKKLIKTKQTEKNQQQNKKKKQTNK